jgi:hypothetical protein
MGENMEELNTLNKSWKNPDFKKFAQDMEESWNTNKVDLHVLPKDETAIVRSLLLKIAGGMHDLIHYDIGDFKEGTDIEVDENIKGWMLYIAKAAILVYQFEKS